MTDASASLKWCLLSLSLDSSLSFSRFFFSPLLSSALSLSNRIFFSRTTCDNSFNQSFFKAGKRKFNQSDTQTFFHSSPSLRLSFPLSLSLCLLSLTLTLSLSFKFKGAMSFKFKSIQKETMTFSCLKKFIPSLSSLLSLSLSFSLACLSIFFTRLNLHFLSLIFLLQKFSPFLFFSPSLFSHPFSLSLSF